MGMMWINTSIGKTEVVGDFFQANKNGGTWKFSSSVLSDIPDRYIDAKTKAGRILREAYEKEWEAKRLLMQVAEIMVTEKEEQKEKGDE